MLCKRQGSLQHLVSFKYKIQNHNSILVQSKSVDVLEKNEVDCFKNLLLNKKWISLWLKRADSNAIQNLFLTGYFIQNHCF